MEMNDILKDQKTLIAIGVGIVIIIAVIALVIMGGGNKQTPTTGNTTTGTTHTSNTSTGNTSTGEQQQTKVEVKTEKLTGKPDKFALVLDFGGYNIYVTECMKNGNFVLAEKAYFPVNVKYDAILYDSKNKVLYMIKDGKVYKENDVTLTGDLNECKEVKQELTKGLDLTKTEPIENLLFA